MSQPERRWMPRVADMPGAITQCLVNPHGDRHLGFNSHEGRFYRLWQHRPPQPLHTGEAVLLRPSDIDKIIKLAMVWVTEHPRQPRSYEISGELAAGAKAVVIRYAELAGAK